VVSFKENVDIWEAVVANAKGGAAAAATGMAQYISYRTANDML
jgi:hypothetical protein